MDILDVKKLDIINKYMELSGKSYNDSNKCIDDFYNVLEYFLLQPNDEIHVRLTKIGTFRVVTSTTNLKSNNLLGNGTNYTGKKKAIYFRLINEFKVKLIQQFK